MPARVATWAAWLGLTVAVGSSIAAVNWYRTWASFAKLDVESGRGMSASTFEAMTPLQQWLLTAVIALIVCAAAMASVRLSPMTGGTVRIMGERKEGAVVK